MTEARDNRLLAQALPAVVSDLAPDGHVAAGGAVDQALGKLQTAAAS